MGTRPARACSTFCMMMPGRFGHTKQACCNAHRSLLSARPAELRSHGTQLQVLRQALQLVRGVPEAACNVQRVLGPFAEDLHRPGELARHSVAAHSSAKASMHPCPSLKAWHHQPGGSHCGDWAGKALCHMPGAAASWPWHRDRAAAGTLLEPACVGQCCPDACTSQERAVLQSATSQMAGCCPGNLGMCSATRAASCYHDQNRDHVLCQFPHGCTDEAAYGMLPSNVASL